MERVISTKLASGSKDPNIKTQMPLETAFLIAHSAALQVKEL